MRCLIAVLGACLVSRAQDVAQSPNEIRSLLEGLLSGNVTLTPDPRLNTVERFAAIATVPNVVTAGPSILATYFDTAAFSGLSKLAVQQLPELAWAAVKDSSQRVPNAASCTYFPSIYIKSTDDSFCSGNEATLHYAAIPCSDGRLVRYSLLDVEGVEADACTLATDTEPSAADSECGEAPLAFPELPTRLCRGLALAQLKAATQSSTRSDGVASRALDGDLAVWVRPRLVTH